MTDKIRAITDALTKQLVDQGKLVEAGFVSMVAMAYPGKTLPVEQYREMRIAFFAGAQHTFGSIFSFLEAGEEPTDTEMNRIGALQTELDIFIAEYARDHMPTKGTG